MFDLSNALAQYGFTLSSIEENNDATVTLSFENGQKATGTLIIGAEGAHSIVRTHLFDGEKAATTPMDLTHVNNTFCYHDRAKALFVRQAHPVFSSMQASSVFAFISMQDVPDPERPEDWKFQVVTGWPGARDQTLSNVEKHKQLKAKAASLAEPYRSAVLWTPDDVEIGYNDLGYWIPERWDTRGGRITLAGDAAHSMPPHRGQGLNNALQDSWNLVQAIESVGDGAVKQDKAIQDASDEIVERGAREVKLSIENAFKSFDVQNLEDTPLFKEGLNRPEGK